MNKLKVIIPGFAREYDGYEEASPSVVLIITDKYKIIIDPGFNRQAILDALSKENLTTGQIDFVILTHTHLDHCVLAGMFENATILDDSDQYLKNGEIRRQGNNILDDGIQIISTPGHDQFHCSIVVEMADMGKVVVAGDVFWWYEGNEPKKDYESLLNLVDPYVKDLDALTDSRKKILEIADYVVPGHGGMFKNEIYN